MSVPMRELVGLGQAGRRAPRRSPRQARLARERLDAVRGRAAAAALAERHQELRPSPSAAPGRPSDRDAAAASHALDRGSHEQVGGPQERVAVEVLVGDEDAPPPASTISAALARWWAAAWG